MTSNTGVGKSASVVIRFWLPLLAPDEEADDGPTIVRDKEVVVLGGDTKRSPGDGTSKSGGELIMLVELVIVLLVPPAAALMLLIGSGIGGATLLRLLISSAGCCCCCCDCDCRTVDVGGLCAEGIKRI